MAENPKLVCIAEAAAAGIQRLRLPKWANPMDHIMIDIVDGRPGPWIHLYSPINIGVNGEDPKSFVSWTSPYRDIYERAYEVYLGPLPDSADYRAAVEAASKLPWPS